MIWLGVAVILAMAALGAPLFAVLMGAAMLGFYSADIELAIVGIELYRIVDTPLLVALPLFTFSGYLLSEANTSTRLVNLMQSLFGWMPSGLAVVAFVACAVFTALTGASGVTIVALGALLGHITGLAESETYQPMNVNFGLFPPPEDKVHKKQRKEAYTSRARASFGAWMGEMAIA